MNTEVSLTTTKSLAAILAGIVPDTDTSDIQIGGLSMDSRQISLNDCFVAVAGEQMHGAKYVNDAITRGAGAILVDDEYTDLSVSGEVPCVMVKGLRNYLPLISNRFYDYPSRDITILGVTGTNGKTTIACILAACLKHQYGESTYVGTLGSGYWPKLKPNLNTTPDLLTLQQHLAHSRANGVDNCTLEASSHGLAQGRLSGIDLNVAIFSNLTHEHLDYHGSMEAYGAAKRTLFQKPVEHAVLNIDDEFGRALHTEIDSAIVRWPYGLHEKSQRYDNLTTAREINASARGIQMLVRTPLAEGLISSSLIGTFNVSNLLAVIAALTALGWEFDDIRAAIASARTVPGRMEVVKPDNEGHDDLPAVVVDYAHTPDALEKSLEALRALTTGQLICLFGCGGDRDQDKRPLMGRIAERFADKVIITSDNPRSESPELIAEEILAGQETPTSSTVELSRDKAILKAIELASDNDIVLIAGKGHENYQLIGEKKIAFSDQLVSKKILSARSARRKS